MINLPYSIVASNTRLRHLAYHWFWCFFDTVQEAFQFFLLHKHLLVFWYMRNELYVVTNKRRKKSPHIKKKGNFFSNPKSGSLLGLGSICTKSKLLAFLKVQLL